MLLWRLPSSWENSFPTPAKEANISTLTFLPGPCSILKGVSLLIACPQLSCLFFVFFVIPLFCGMVSMFLLHTLQHISWTQESSCCSLFASEQQWISINLFWFNLLSPKLCSWWPLRQSLFYNCSICIRVSAGFPPLYVTVFFWNEFRHNSLHR